MSRLTARWLGERVQIHAFLTKKKKERLDAVLRRHGIGFTEFLNIVIDEKTAERKPESQDGMMRVQIDRDKAQLLADDAFKEAQRLRESADDAYRTKESLEQRRTLRAEAAKHDEAAAWCMEIVDGAEYRQNLIASGQAVPRFRRAYTSDSQSL